jgi:hypothetical protein
MARTNTVRLRAVPRSVNGRPTRRPGVRLLAAYRSLRARSLGLLGRAGNAVGQVLGMALVLALSIVLAHAMLVLVFPA